MGGLDGKVVLITGGGRGIGRGIARGMAREGARLAITGRNADTLADAVAELEAIGAEVLAVPADVTAEADVLRDEAESYAQRLFLSTVETEGYRYDGMVHGFLRMAGKVDRAEQHLAELQRLCSPIPCEELKQLKRAVDDYKKAKK